MTIEKLRWRGRLLCVLVTLAMAFAMSITSVQTGSAQQNGSAATQNTEMIACVQKDTGLLRIVNRTTKCKVIENRIYWNQRGPVGPTGPQGKVGSQGTQGKQGLQGKTGPVGPSGSKGAQGLTGAAGPQGDQGDQGDQGLTGATGAAGPQGEQGLTGATGAAGPQGEQGATGSQGAPGVSGLTTVSPPGTTWTASNSQRTRTVTATCTGGKKALGGGYNFTILDGTVAKNQPTASGDGWEVIARNPNNTSGTITAYALCATVAP